MMVDWTGCEDVEVVAGKVSGAPILTHSRVPAETVISSADAGETPEEIAYSFELSVDQVRRVLDFAFMQRLHHSAA